MESRDFVYLQEAYQEIYQLDEEVEIATEYFYEMGLNAQGVNTLIEELGVEEFVEWVYDIAESYTLTEARAGGSRIEPVTKGGKSIGSLRGGAKSAAINRLRKEKAARREAEERASAERPSGLKAALRSQAEKTAKKEQPKAKKETPTQTKKGIAGAIEWAKKKAQTDIEQTRKGLKTLGDTWQSVSDTKAAQAARIGAKKGSRFLERHGKTLGGAAGRAAAQNPAVVATFRAGQRLRSAMQREDYEFEVWVEGLWEEGYDLSDYTWEGLYEAYIEEVSGYGRVDPMTGNYINRSLPFDRPRRSAHGSSAHLNMTPLKRAEARSEALRARNNTAATRRANKIDKFVRNATDSAVDSFRAASQARSDERKRLRNTQESYEAYVDEAAGRHPLALPPAGLTGGTSAFTMEVMPRVGRINRNARLKQEIAKRASRRAKVSNDGEKAAREAQESYDAYNTIADYLLDEGYAHDLDSADAIIASMSEDWIVDILEGEKVFPLRKVADKTNELLRRIRASKSPEEQAKLRKRMDKMNDEYWQPN